MDCLIKWWWACGGAVDGYYYNTIVWTVVGAVLGLCPRNAGQSTRLGHACKKGTPAVSTAQYIRLPPVSEDKGQYSMPYLHVFLFGTEAISSGFEPAKALVRGLPLPRPPSFRVRSI